MARKHRGVLVGLVLGAALALPLAGQRTWIVDSANGPGTDYLDIDAAYAAAGVGDTLVVRPGNGMPYDLPAAITRSIRIVAPGPSPVPVRQRCHVQNVPRGDIVVLDNMDFSTESYNAYLTPRDCSGLVIMSRMYASPFVVGGAGTVLNSDRVVLTRFRNYPFGGPALRGVDSNVWVIDSDVRPYYSSGQPAIGLRGGTQFTGTTARRRTTWLIGSRIEGGIPHPNGLTGPDSGVEVSHCDLLIAGRSTILGCAECGAGTWCPSNPLSRRYPSIWRSSYSPPDPRASWLVRDPNTTLDNCIRPSVGYELVREFPAVLPGEAIRGQPQSILTYGPTNSIVAVFASFVHGEEPVKLSVGDVWLDPYLVVAIGNAAVATDRTATLHTTIPTWLKLGDVLVYQATSLSPSGQWEISQPGFAVVRDP
ncbi:MAG: hypothetical protein IPM29_10325 [Planctomycetes bacterium]|nr:hypothetical protein [Planctomycetota bacterium]